LLYKGHKVLPYCPRCGTPLSSHEVAQGYDEVTDPAITVKFKLKGRENQYVLAWTTTPWTLPGNVALAVGEEIEYVKVQQGDELYYLAAERLSHVLEGAYQVLETLKGRAMDGWEYEPLFPYLKDALGREAPHAWLVTAASEMVSAEEGSGVVHTAVMYGEEDYALGERLGLPKHHTVDRNGRFTADVKPWAGMFVKDADRLIIRALKNEGKLYKEEKYTHTYPFCWRCDTPLLYYALDSWFIQTTARQEHIIANNQKIHWHPEYMRDGRFGNFLETMKDWALSRDRYWGTPLPIWICDTCGHPLCIGSRSELMQLAQDRPLAETVDFHRPYIDEVFLHCPQCQAQMRRVPQVIDTWFDSGMMHTAQWHYPFENQELFQGQFPADFICEGMDQTRGWFYTLLVTSTLLYPDYEYPHPFRHVIVTGMGLDAGGKKMSKSRGNVLDPMDFVNDFGADALRWYIYAGSAPWRDRPLLKEEAGKVLHGFINTIINVYNFFVLYASIDGFDPRKHANELRARPLLDRWIISRFAGTLQTVTRSLDVYDVVAATESLEALVDDFSNWYVRVSRPRFWGEGLSEDKRYGYSTLYEVLLGLAKVLAPFMPFLAESLYRGLGAPGAISVHLCEYPQAEPEHLDVELEQQMALARRVVSLGRAARQNCGIKVRQPLPSMNVQHTPVPQWPEELVTLVKGELNVKKLEFTEENLREQHIAVSVEPQMSVLGPKFGKLAPRIKQAITNENAASIAQALERTGAYRLVLEGETVSLTAEDLRVVRSAKPGAAVAFDEECFVVLDPRITSELRQEGYVRELVHGIQQLRKDAGYEVTDRIELFVNAAGELAQAIAAHQKHVQEETLAVALHSTEPKSGTVDHMDELNVNGLSVKVGLKRVRSS
jgi:isoleucyl-tRNA synthetase